MCPVIYGPSGAPIIIEDGEDLSSPLPPPDCHEPEENGPGDGVETSLSGAPILDPSMPGPDEPPPPPVERKESVGGAPILD